MTSADRLARILFAGIVIAGAFAAHAQPYPDRVIRVITTPAGSGSDFAARLVGQALGRTFGQQVIVDNRGNNAAEIVIKSPADGYTLLCWGSPVWITQFLLENLAWDPVRMARRHADALRSLRAIYIDAGKKDEFFLDLGAEAFLRELEELGITDVFFELFEAGHGGIEYRYPLAIRYLAERLQ